jgi:hypothetical protein
MESLLSSFPCIDAIWAIVLWLVLPPLVFLILLYITKYSDEEDNAQYLPKPLATVVWMTYQDYAGSIALWSVLWMFFILLNQASYIHKNVDFVVGDDLGYYFRVDLPASNTMQTISAAETTTSFSAISQSQSNNNNEILYVIYSVAEGEWGNVLTENNLQAACLAEREVLLSMPCLDSKR